MTYKEKCLKSYKETVKLRDRWCIICGKQGHECHEVFFRSQGNWVVLYDPDYGVKLCGRCHRLGPEAPHVDNKAFFRKLIPILERTQNERAEKILMYHESPKPPQIIKPDWKELFPQIEKKREEASTVWMDP